MIKWKGRWPKFTVVLDVCAHQFGGPAHHHCPLAQPAQLLRRIACPAWPRRCQAGCQRCCDAAHAIRRRKTAPALLEGGGLDLCRGHPRLPWSAPDSSPAGAANSLFAGAVDSSPAADFHLQAQQILHLQVQRHGAAHLLCCTVLSMQSWRLVASAADPHSDWTTTYVHH